MNSSPNLPSKAVEAGAESLESRALIHARPHSASEAVLSTALEAVPVLGLTEGQLLIVKNALTAYAGLLLEKAPSVPTGGLEDVRGTVDAALSALREDS